MLPLRSRVVDLEAALLPVEGQGPEVHQEIEGGPTPMIWMGFPAGMILARGRADHMGVSPRGAPTARQTARTLA